MNLKKLLTAGLYLVSSVLGALEKAPLAGNPPTIRSKRLSSLAEASSTPNITTALQLDATPPPYCPFSFGWSADENHMTLRSYHTEFPDEQDKQIVVERIEHYIQIFSFFHSENNAPSEISPRPSTQQTTGNKTTLTYKNGLRFPATISVKFPEISNNKLFVDQLMIMFKVFIKRFGSFNSLPIQISILPETAQCADLVRSEEDDLKFMRKQRDLLIGILLGLPLTIFTICAISCCTIKIKELEEVEQQQRDRNRAVARETRNRTEPSRAALLSFLSGMGDELAKNHLSTDMEYRIRNHMNGNNGQIRLQLQQRAAQL